MSTAAAAAAPPTDLLTQLRIQTAEPSLDESIGNFFLEMCEGDVGRAAALYREQQPAASGPPTAAAAAQPPRPVHRSSLSASVVTRASAGGRKRAKATNVILPKELELDRSITASTYETMATTNSASSGMDLSSSSYGGTGATGGMMSQSEPGYSRRATCGDIHNNSSSSTAAQRKSMSSTSYETRRSTGSHSEPTGVGLVTAHRVRSFANNADVLNYGLIGNNNYSFTSIPDKMVQHVAIPGAFNETYADPQGNFVLQERRESGNLDRRGSSHSNTSNSRGAGSHSRQASGGGPTTTTTKMPSRTSSSRSSADGGDAMVAQQNQKEHSSSPYGQPACSELVSQDEESYRHLLDTTALKGAGAADDDDDDDEEDRKPAAIPKDIHAEQTKSAINYSTEPMAIPALKPFQSDSLLNDDEAVDVDEMRQQNKVERRWSNASTLTTASVEEDAENSLRSNNTSFRSSAHSFHNSVTLLPDLEEEKERLGDSFGFIDVADDSESHSNFKAPADIAAKAPLHKPDPPGENVEEDVKKPAAVETRRTTDQNSKVRRAPATRPGAVSSSSSAEPAANATKRGDKDTELSPAMILPRQPVGKKNHRSEAPGSVAKSQSMIATMEDRPPILSTKKATPKAKQATKKEDKHQPVSIIKMYEPSSGAPRPSAVQATMDESLTSVDSAPAANTNRDPKRLSRRKTRATQPGAVHTKDDSNLPNNGRDHRLNESESSLNASASAMNASDASSKKRRGFAASTTPGAVKVVSSEPQVTRSAEPEPNEGLRQSHTKSSSMDASNTSRDSIDKGSEKIQASTGKIRHRGLGSVKPGMVSVSADDASETTTKQRTKAGILGRKNHASKMVAESSTCDKQEDRSETKAGKFRPGPAPEVVRVSAEQAQARSKEKGKVVYKHIPLPAASKPGAVNVKSAGENEASESNTGAADGAATASVELASSDPSLDGLPAEGVQDDSNKYEPDLLPKLAARPKVKNSRGKRYTRDNSPRRIVSDPLNGMPTAPIKSRRSSDGTEATKPKKGGIFGMLFKSKNSKK